MQIVNFSHPLTEEQLAQIAQAEQLDREDIHVQQISVQLDQQRPFLPQILALIEHVTFERDDNRICVVLPGLSAAAVLLVEQLRKLEKRVIILRLKPKVGPITGFDFAESVEVS